MGGSNQSKFLGTRSHPVSNGLENGLLPRGDHYGSHAINNGVSLGSDSSNGISNGGTLFSGLRESLSYSAVRILHELEADEEEEGSGEPRGPAATEVDTSRMTSEDMKGMINSMKCMSCGWIPKPDRRFVCLDGHHYCFTCGSDRKEKKEGICGLQLTNRDNPQRQNIARTRQENSGVDGENPGSSTASQHLSSCQKEIQEIHRDPVYCALFNNMKLKCPVSDHPAAACRKEVYGVELESHLVECTLALASNLGVSLAVGNDE